MHLVYLDLHEPLAIDELVDRIAQLRGSRPANPRRAVLDALPAYPQLVPFDDLVVPAWLLFDGVRFRVGQAEWQGGYACLPLEAFFPFDLTMAPAQGGASAPINLFQPNGEACLLAVPEPEGDAAAAEGGETDDPDSVLVVLEEKAFGVRSFSGGSFVATLRTRAQRIDLTWEPDTPSRLRRRAGRDKQLADALWRRLRAGRDPQSAPELLFATYPRLIWAREAPGRPWRDVVASDDRLCFYETKRAIPLIGLQRTADAPAATPRKPTYEGRSNVVKPEALPDIGAYPLDRPLTRAELAELFARYPELEGHWGPDVDAPALAHVRQLGAASAVTLLHAGSLLTPYMLKLLKRHGNQPLVRRRGYTIWNFATFLALPKPRPRCLEEARREDIAAFLEQLGEVAAPTPTTPAEALEDLADFYSHLERARVIRSSAFVIAPRRHEGDSY